MTNPNRGPGDRPGSRFDLTFLVEGPNVTVLWGADDLAFTELGPVQLDGLETMLATAQQAVADRRELVARVGIPTPLGR